MRFMNLFLTTGINGLVPAQPAEFLHLMKEKNFCRKSLIKKKAMQFENIPNYIAFPECILLQ